ncbi:MAG: hypothetical protein IRY85_02115 [Micromonosporaceae bacterium]|nr:hypothetical protein [Micromonosporaceae bacterium]
MTLSRASRTRRRYPSHVIALITVTVMSLVACTGGPSPSAGETEVQAPTDWPAELPFDRGVGPVALGYVAGGVSYVLLESGEQYLVPGDLRRGGRASLSPEGRWLLLGDTLYDTENGRTTTVALAAAPRSWSPNGRWLLTECSSEGTGSRQQRLDATAGSTIDVAGLPSEDDGVCGADAVLDDGNVITAVLPAGSGPVREVSLRVLNPQTGGVVREIDVDLTSILQTEESVAGWHGLLGLLVGPDGELFLRVIGGVDRQTIGVVIAADDGRPVRRVDVPAEGGWVPVAIDDEGIVIVHGDDGNGAQISVVDPDGAIHRRHHLPPGAQLMLVPGGVITI